MIVTQNKGGNMGLQFTDNALTVLENRYLRKDDTGKVIETPEQLIKRVADHIASADARYDETKANVKKTAKSFYDMMAALEFMPNSPTLMNAGLDKGQLSACFVLPIEDTMEGIFGTLQSTALIHKTGGGTGFSFSRIRPTNSVVRSTGGVASGPISFMKVYDGATQAVKQGGRRRGANMGILRVDHPDILEFIKCKSEDGEISNFNISVAITDEFMKQVEAKGKYDLVDPRTKKVTGQLDAKEVFDLIVEMAHSNGEPGIVFIDKINAANPVPHLGDVEATNPCGEQPLLPYESCNLGSINLYRMIKEEGDQVTVDWDKIKKTVHTAVHFLDNVIDVNCYPLAEIDEQTKKTRKIGLGVMGWASLLGVLGIAYDSQEAIDLAKEIMSFIKVEADAKSTELAKLKGTFPAFKGSIYDKQGQQMRNATRTTIAPTGTISIIAGPTSGGVEPVFALVYYRYVMDGHKLPEVDPAFEKVAKARGIYSDELLQKIADNRGSVQGLDEVPADIQAAFRTSMDIAPEWHVKMQAAFQDYCDNAVSKTINLPNEASKEDVAQTYMLSYQLGCKGTTVYRDGSRSMQVLNAGKDKKEEVEEKLVEVKAATVKKRPDVVVGTTTRVSTGCGNLYVIMNQDEDGDFTEVFTQMGKAGGCAASQLESIGRLITLAMKSGIDGKEIVAQLKGIRCPAPSWANGKKIFSCADAIAGVVEKRINDQHDIIDDGAVAQHHEDDKGKEIMAAIGKDESIIGMCPDCGASLRSQEGCNVCASCGYSRC